MPKKESAKFKQQKTKTIQDDTLFHEQGVETHGIRTERDWMHTINSNTVWTFVVFGLLVLLVLLIAGL